VSKLTIKFLYDYVDEALWRMSVYYTMNALKAAGHDAMTANVLAQPIGPADVYVFYRCVSKRALDVMREVKSGGFVVYAIDDYLFQPDCKFKWKVPPESYLEFFKTAHAVMLSSKHLLDKAEVPHKFRYYTTIDRESFNLLGGQKKPEGSEFAIGWLAGHSHKSTDGFVGQFLKALNDRLTPDKQCIFHQFGRHSVVEPFARVKVVTNLYVPVNKWRDMYRKFASLGLDAVICPLPEDDEFSRCKSELKYVEAGAMGVPVVASRMPQFFEVIHEEENGLFASSPEEFAEQVMRLMTKPGLASRLGDRAKAHVESECLAPARTQQFLEGLRRVMMETGYAKCSA